MKLFDGFEAFSFPEEDMILVTQNGYLYYCCSEHKYWKKYRNAGNDHLNVDRYPDVSEVELIDAMNGIFPRKETDFMRLCDYHQLSTGNMLKLLKEDYEKYMSDSSIYATIFRFLYASAICYKSFEEVKKLFDIATQQQQNSQQVLMEIKKLSLAIIGKDIFREEIGIADGHDCSSYFWIMPVRVLDYHDTNCWDNVAEMRSIEISIEEDDVNQYLTPFLLQYFDEKLEANKRRAEDRWTDNEGIEHTSFVNGFEWYLTYNFFTYDSIKRVLHDMRDTIDALSSGRENSYTEILRKKRGIATYELVYAKKLSTEQVQTYNANRTQQDNTESTVIIDFYRRFIYRMEYMMKVGEENGFDYISFMGP